MIIAGGSAALVGIVLVGIVHGLPMASDSAWLYPLFFFALAVAHSGVRLGRKTYIVDLAGGNRRTDYVAVSNTVIGIVLLLTGSVGALTTVLPTSGIILILAAMGLSGAWMSAYLPETQHG